MIAALLAEQKSYFDGDHNGGSDRDLYELGCLPRQALPESVQCYRVLSRAKLPAFDAAKVTERIRAGYPIVDDLVAMFPLVLAGGLISAIVTDTDISNDIDMFIVAPQGDPSKMLDQCIKFIEANHGIHAVHYNGHVISISMVDSPHILQIILRVYTSVSQVLHGFDIGASCVAYTGEKFYFTGLGRFAFEYGHNIIDMSMRSTSYESRLVKYWRRGFGFIMPGFSPNKMSVVLHGHRPATIEYELGFLLLKCSETRGYDLLCADIIVAICMAVADYKSRRRNRFDHDGSAALSFSYRADYGPFERRKLIPLRGPYPSNAAVERFVRDNLRRVRFYSFDTVARILMERIESTRREWMAELMMQGYRLNIANPTTQQFGMINPAAVAESEWYGSAYAGGKSE